jgi:hypothetical protein
MDFTLKIYKLFLKTLQQRDFSFQTFLELIENPEKKVIVLRHDVDQLPHNSLLFARIEATEGIRGTYYFRAIPRSWDETVIKEIAGMGHEVGYHYEDVNLMARRLRVSGVRRQEERGGEGERGRGREDDFVFAGQKFWIKDHIDLQDRKLRQSRNPESEANRELQDNGRLEKELADIAIESFNKNLKKLRELAPVKTICMHGSPMNRWDNRLLWKYYDYHDFGIVGEPYFDINFDEVLYLTDTGRRWDGDSFNVRDKSISRKEHKGIAKDAKEEIPPSLSPSSSEALAKEDLSLSPSSPLKFHSTFDIIRAAEEGKLPEKIMMTFHPQRWTDKPFPWLRELVWQNFKNVVKYITIKVNSN